MSRALRGSHALHKFKNVFWPCQSKIFAGGAKVQKLGRATPYEFGCIEVCSIDFCLGGEHSEKPDISRQQANLHSEELDNLLEAGCVPWMSFTG